jgi:methyl coenzyme M reductase beta subunit
MHYPLAITVWGSLHVFLGLCYDAMDAEKLAFDLVDKFGLDSVRRTVISVCYGSRDRA